MRRAGDLAQAARGPGSGAIVVAEGLRKRSGGTMALDRLDLEVPRGSVRCGREFWHITDEPALGLPFGQGPAGMLPCLR